MPQLAKKPNIEEKISVGCYLNMLFQVVTQDLVAAL